MKIIDCFIFYNEIDLLLYRLNILDTYVDHFIIVEANHTFVGKPKPSLYLENQDLFIKFKPKIIHILVDMPYHHPTINFANREQWKNEAYQRNSIKKGIEQLSLDNEDILVISDVDEITHPDVLKQIKLNTLIIHDHLLEQDWYNYNLNTKMYKTWKKAKILNYKKYSTYASCEAIRSFKTENVIKNGGWHLSYFGDVYYIKNKLEHYSHVENNKASITDIKAIQKKITNQTDLVTNIKIHSLHISDNENLPVDYEKYLTKFIDLNIPKKTYTCFDLVQSKMLRFFYKNGKIVFFLFLCFLLNSIYVLN